MVTIPPSAAQTSYSISQLARACSLSRSTLLHYHRIGLLTPSSRDANGYRRYSAADYARLQRITTYRQAGLPLAHIAHILDGPATAASQLLEQRLRQINRDIAHLRQQQQVIVKLLGHDSRLRHTRILTKHNWTQLLRNCGMNDDDMRQWHIQFERALPEQHQDFLESLGIEEEEIRRIRGWCQETD